MQLYILRHGETAFNRLGIIQGGSVDTDLNELGRSQARAFFEYYNHIHFDMVVTSDLRRTHQTVQYFIEKGITWRQDPDIREMNWGTHEGQPSTPAQRAEYAACVASWQSGDYHARLDSGESAFELGERHARFIEWLKTRPADRLLICSHGRAMRALVSLMKENPLSDMEGTPHANTGTYMARLENGKFIFDMENDVRHLVDL